MSGGERAMVKLKAWAAAAAGVAGGLVYGPLLVQSAIVAALVVVVVLLGLAHAHDMTVGRAAALYGGRAVLALAKAAAIVLVEWPLRAGHRVGARFDVVLRVQLTVVRAGYRVAARWDTSAVAARSPQPLLMLVARPGAGGTAEEQPLAVVRRGA